MMCHPATRWRARRERGYALLLVVFFTSLLLLGAITIGPNLFTQGQRERENELIWRGEQYVRGIKLYYRKTGRFPPSLDDLTEKKTGIRFMRKAYTDPMNTKDGSWRLIYVGAVGQLIGSVNQNQEPLQLPLAGGVRPGGAQPLAGGQPPGRGISRTDVQQDQNPSSPAPQSSADQSGLDDSSGIIGGSIIGVGSKVNRASVRIYQKGRKYNEWEFIWDPRKDAIAVGQPGTQTGAPIGQPIGTPAGPPPPPQPNNPPQNPPQPQEP